ncbi:ion channel [bacterium]|nr:ion channel [bacterium]
MSDYGASTGRLLAWFVVCICVFQQIYVFPTYLGFTPVVCELSKPEMEWCTLQVRSLYFSLVTTTSVGFGDITPKPTLFIGHVVVIFNIVVGYTLLGALFARIGTLLQE